MSEYEKAINPQEEPKLYTKKELWAVILEDHSDFLFYLRERWLDEQDYEDIADYFKEVKKRIPQAIKISADPAFIIYFKCRDGTLQVKINFLGVTMEMIGIMYLPD